MKKQFLSIEEFNEMLNQWNGETIKVSKEEVGDVDELVMSLESISYQTDTHRIDDYEPKHTLQLNGRGKVETEFSNMEVLPESMYEIPLEDSSTYAFDGSQFRLTTDRGVYTIKAITSEI